MTTAATLIETLCTCVPKPLGLDFVLTAGCVLHDRCMCHEAEHDPVPQGDEACSWCASYVALLKAVATLDGPAQAQLKGVYLAARSTRG